MRVLRFYVWLDKNRRCVCETAEKGENPLNWVGVTRQVDMTREDTRIQFFVMPNCYGTPDQEALKGMARAIYDDMLICTHVNLADCTKERYRARIDRYGILHRHD